MPEFPRRYWLSISPQPTACRSSFILWDSIHLAITFGLLALVGLEITLPAPGETGWLTNMDMSVDAQSRVTRFQRMVPLDSNRPQSDICSTPKQTLKIKFNVVAIGIALFNAHRSC